MFLKSMVLEDVRCFERLEIDFSAGEQQDDIRKWTVLVGENGSGKSTILRSAALITAGSNALAEVIGSPSDWVRVGAESCKISAVLQTKKGEQRVVSLEIKASDNTSKMLSRASRGLADLDDALAHTARNYFVAGYGSSRRLASESSLGFRGSRFRHPRAQSTATLFENAARLNPLETWAMELDYEQGSKGIETVQSVLSSFLPSLKFDRIDKRAKQLLFKTPDGSIPLSQLSDGYQNVAAWVGDLLYRVYQTFEDLEHPLKTRGLLIIDELDLHLHPSWQRSLHDFVQKKLPNMQLLVTTHSAVTAQQADEQQLHYLKRKGKSVTLHRFETDPSDLLVNQLLISDVFGLETDESLDVERKKARYRKLRQSPQKLSLRQAKEFKALKHDIDDSLTQRRSVNMSRDTQVEKLLAIQAAIQKKRR